MKKVLKRFLQLFFALIFLLVFIGVLFVSFSPQFGGKPTEQDTANYQKTGHYQDGIFVNLIPTTMDMSFKNIKNTLKQYWDGVPNQRPDFYIPVDKIDSTKLVNDKQVTRLIWFGHSAFLLQVEGQTILLDPMLSDVPAPHPWLGGQRYNKIKPLEIEEIPAVDAIIISHDHYDHLDYESIEKLKDKTRHFYVPLGVGAHFLAWGIAPERIHEMDWWQEIKHENLTLAFVPSRHFSGRGLTDRNTTLWGSWVIAGDNHNFYFSGDGGYGPHFKAIGDKYGPFNLAMIECGQYNQNWSQIHMMPEESAQAAVDLKAQLMMPIHWGAFTLSLHSWTDPIIRVREKAKALHMPLIAPRIGQEIKLDETLPPLELWWENKNM